MEGDLGEGGAWAEQIDAIDKGGGGSVDVVPEGEGQRAALRYRTLARDSARSLVEVELLTGRKHQIRAQLAELGAPILGDFRYGNPTQFAAGHGVALHAVRLTVEHPTQREPVTVVAPPPDAWDGLFPDAVAEAVRAAES